MDWKIPIQKLCLPKSLMLGKQKGLSKKILKTLIWGFLDPKKHV